MLSKLEIKVFTTLPLEVCWKFMPSSNEHKQIFYPSQVLVNFTIYFKKGDFIKSEI